MLKEQIYAILREIVTEEGIKTDLERLVAVGYNSILSLHFVAAIEDYFDLEIDNDDINSKFFSDFDYLEELLNGYLSLKE